MTILLAWFALLIGAQCILIGMAIRERWYVIAGLNILLLDCLVLLYIQGVTR